jgi:hypothetical protein
MGGGTVELIVERAVLVQNPVKNVSRNPPRREAGHFGRNCKS